MAARGQFLANIAYITISNIGDISEDMRVAKSAPLSVNVNIKCCGIFLFIYFLFI